MKKEKSRKLRWYKRFLRSCHAVIYSPHTMKGIAVASLIIISLCFFIMLYFFKELERSVKEEAERNAEKLAMLEYRIISQQEETKQTLLLALDVSTEKTIRTILRLDAAYQNLLDAQKRRTLESFYNEDVLVKERKEAAAAFTAGRYVTASRLYGEISASHPEDQEARFYKYYALFLNNKQDKSNYRLIRESFTLLERQGYARRELTETLQFIAAETGMGKEQQ